MRRAALGVDLVSLGVALVMVAVTSLAALGCEPPTSGVAHSASSAAPGRFEPGPSMHDRRDLFAWLPLPSGDGLALGGHDGAGAFLSSVERFELGSGSFVLEAPLVLERDQHTASLVGDGRVLVAGGYSSGVYLDHTELGPPFEAAPAMLTARLGHGATVQDDGSVLLSGGYHDGGLTSDVERFVPASSEGEPNVFVAAGPLATARARHTSTLLRDGGVLVIGGLGGDGALASAERYEPSQDAWQGAGTLSEARFFHAAFEADDGAVYVVGGRDLTSAKATVERWDPSTRTFSSVGSLGTPRYNASVTPLSDGTALVVGGSDGVDQLASSERLVLATGETRPDAELAVAREEHAAHALPDGGVLIVGGRGAEAALASSERFVPEEPVVPPEGDEPARASCAAAAGPATASFPKLAALGVLLFAAARRAFVSCAARSPARSAARRAPGSARRGAAGSRDR